MYFDKRIFRACAYYKLAMFRSLAKMCSLTHKPENLTLDGNYHANLLGAFHVCLNYQAIQETNLATELSHPGHSLLPMYNL